MSPVKFPCPHCGQLMAVGIELLGRQVRCPHCQQVLTAPAAAADYAAETANLASPISLPESPGLPDVNPFAGVHESPPARDASPPAVPEAPAVVNGKSRSSVPRPTMLDEVTRRNSWVLAILVPYAVFMTVVAITYFIKFQNQAQIHPLEMIPDLIGEFQRKQTKGGAQTLKLPPPDQELPRKLVTTLGRALTVGAVEVTPLGIEHRAWAAYTKEKNQSEAVKRDVPDVLVLRVRLRNVSPDLTFYPTDPYFDRRPKHSGDRPYVLVEVGDKKFFGGWIMYETEEGRVERSWVEGQERDREPLKPGEARETVLVTHPKDAVLEAVRRSKGKAVWRVHVRRGLVPYHNREIPASAVVGVEFTADDVKTTG